MTAALAVTADGPNERHARLRPRTWAEIQAQTPPRWIVRGVIPERALVLVYGASGSGKTFISLDLALSVARGQRWFAHRVNRGGVIYIAGEGHLRLRLSAYEKHHGITGDDMSSFRAVATSINLYDGNADLKPLLIQLRLAAQELGGVALVVLDTLNSMMGAGDENAPDDMGVMLGAAREIMAGLGCSVAFVHHTGKDEGRGARGHSSLRAAVDTELVVKSRDGQRIAQVSKQRDGESGLDFPFTLKRVDLGPDPDPQADEGERLDSCVIEPMADLGAPAAHAQPPLKPRKRDGALEILRNALQAQGLPAPSVRGIPPESHVIRLQEWQQLWAESVSEKDPAREFRRLRDELLEAGLVAIRDPFVWLAPERSK